jgi:type IV pilus assembly protein PilA
MSGQRCAKCFRSLDVAGLQPGSMVTCKCGNVAKVLKDTSRGMIIAVLGAMGLVIVFIVGVLAAIAIPNYIRFQSRARQAECQSNLKAFFTEQRIRDEFELDLSKLSFSPERGNRYAYFVSRGPLEDRSGPQVSGTEGARGVGVDTFRFPNLKPITLDELPQDVAAQVGVSGTCPDCSITIVCAGDVDNSPDDPNDVWSISTQERQMPSGETVYPGEPYQHVNDVTTD